MASPLFRPAGMVACCPMCAPAAAAPGHRCRRVLSSISSSIVAAAPTGELHWPHRPVLKITASEKLSHPPQPSRFPGTFPLEFVRQATGIAVRSVAPDAFPRFWQDSFRSILAAKGASSEHDEFWKSGASNGRALQWRCLEIPPNSAYPLHAHPGIEVYLVVRGVLHEYRMVGPPVLRADQFDNADTVAQALDFRNSSYGRSFERRSLSEGDFNVNEIGSVHQVFTDAEGCILLVLGAGANVTIEEEQWPTDGPFLAVTVSGTAGWQGQKGGVLPDKDAAQGTNGSKRE